MKTPQTSFFREALGVFFFAVFCVYSWALLVFFWDLPAFLFYLSAWDILGYLSYQFAFALGESAVISLLAAGLARVLPRRGEVAVTGSWLVFSFAVSAIVFKELSVIAQGLMKAFSLSGFAAAQAALGIWAFTALALPAISYKLSGGGRFARWTRNFLENLQVLSGLYAALGLIGIAIVIYRNV